MMDKDVEMALMPKDKVISFAYHSLKTLPEYFNAIDAGIKTFEIRKNDRELKFKVGDILILREYNPKNKFKYTGRTITAMIVYVLEDAPEFGLMPGFCLMGIAKNYNRYSDEKIQLAGDLLNELEAQSFGETVQLCNECKLFFLHEDMACEGCCNDCSAEHDATFGKHDS